MFTLKRKPLSMPSADQALPGRDQPIPTAKTHFVNGAPLKGPYPQGAEKALFGLGCFWGAERKFWELPGVTVTAVGYAGGLTPNPTYEEVCSGRTGHNEAVFVVFDPKQVSYEQLLKLFFESHNPTQGMRQGNDVGTQYRSGIYIIPRRSGKPRRPPRRPTDGAGGERPGPHHHRDRAGAGILFRRGLSPAISGQKPARLLRARRHRRDVPDRHRVEAYCRRGRHKVEWARLSGGHQASCG